MDVRYSILWIYLSLFNQLHIVGHLGCSHSFAIVNSTALSSTALRQTYH